MDMLTVQVIKLTRGLRGTNEICRKILFTHQQKSLVKSVRVVIMRGDMSLRIDDRLASLRNASPEKEERLSFSRLY